MGSAVATADPIATLAMAAVIAAAISGASIRPARRTNRRTGVREFTER
jgi:hypothetical protein